ncbi:NAD-dependent epimerase/dehydratase family protein [Embleya sp. MST-111070]|uniref:NAD-dependent epimerase/dehydratase family protein n=1 Tax=Embleya sp. MST-111070 TaxID=3398231 RepID=UPI003F7345AF
MRILVTGGAGFIGSHVVECLVEAGHEVRVFDLVSVEGVDSVVGDVRDADAVARALVGVDAVCHQAAKVGLGLDLGDAPDYVGCNDLGTAVLLAAMGRAGIGRLVLASSMVVYGEGLGRCAEHGDVVPGARPIEALEAGRFEPPCPVCGMEVTPGRISEEAAPDPRNVYAATKLAQEHLAGAWARSTGGVATALRYHNVYGPRMPLDTPYAGVAAIFRSMLRAGLPPRVYEDGGQRRDFVHVRDVATANLAAFERSTPGLRAYNVATGVPRTVGEMALALAAAHAGPTPITTAEYRLGDVRHITASAARLEAELGWRAQIEFADGMAQFAHV